MAHSLMTGSRGTGSHPFKIGRKSMQLSKVRYISKGREIWGMVYTMLRYSQLITGKFKQINYTI